MFKIGEEVIYYNVFFDKKYKAKIFGIGETTSCKHNEYAITYKLDNGETINAIASEKVLSKRKSKDELEKGDKFIDGYGYECKVIAKTSNKQMGAVYFVEHMDGYKVRYLGEIDKIVYE